MEEISVDDILFESNNSLYLKAPFGNEMYILNTLIHYEKNDLEEAAIIKKDDIDKIYIVDDVSKYMPSIQIVTKTTKVFYFVLPYKFNFGKTNSKIEFFI